MAEHHLSAEHLQRGETSVKHWAMLYVFDKRLPRESVSKHPPHRVNVGIEEINGSAARPNTGGHLTE